MLKIYRLVGPFLVLQCLLVAAAAAAAFFMERLGVRSGVDDVVVSEGARVRASAASSTTRGSLAQTVPNMAANGMHSTVADMAEKEQYIETRSDKSPILAPWHLSMGWGRQPPPSPCLPIRELRPHKTFCASLSSWFLVSAAVKWAHHPQCMCHIHAESAFLPFLWRNM